MAIIEAVHYFFDCCNIYNIIPDLISVIYNS